MPESNNRKIVDGVCCFCDKPLDLKKINFRSSKNGNYICEDCINLWYQAMSSRKKAKTKGPAKHMTPMEMKAELDKSIIGQEDAKIAISIAVYNHYKRLDMHTNVKIAKSNVLLIGPTGSGKTLIAKSIAEMLDVPFAIADCTSLTEAGYVGDDVENVLLKLLQAADDDIEKAERGIIFLDEVDKLAKNNVGPSLTKDPSGEGVQQALLKLIEGTVSNVALTGGRKNPNERCVQINTENILFICGGAFPGLETIINKRTCKSNKSLGFGAQIEKEKEKTISEALKEIYTEDLVQYGLIPELIGRLPVVVGLEELDEAAMIAILTEPKDSIVKQYQEIFAYDGVDLIFTEDALKDIAKETIKKKTGARGLRGIMENLLRQYMYIIPSDRNIDKCVVERLDKVTLVKNHGAAEIAC